MSFILDFKSYVRVFRDWKHHNSIKNMPLSAKNHMAAELIRNTHSIEKGLSLEEPRLGFGIKKMDSMLEKILLLKESENSYHREACGMAFDAICEYTAFHKEQKFEGELLSKLQKFLEENPPEPHEEKMGGTVLLEKSAMDFDIAEMEKLFQTRHSIRDFDHTPVDKELLKKALVLAQRAPSACNRQGVRAYILDHKKSPQFVRSLGGIGGFAESVDQFVLITGKKSAYRIDEENQFSVSASIYAAYLTLTLHLYGMGSCLVQRSLLWNKIWENTRKEFSIPEDEQLVCMLAVGNLKGSCKVPVSYRLKNENMIRFL